MNPKAKSASKKTDAQILIAQKERLKKLKDALLELHFLSLPEVEEILKSMQFMPEVAYKEVYALIKAGKSKQNDYFAKQIEKNPEFVSELEKSVAAEYKKIIHAASEQESNNADIILDQLYENI